MSNPLSTIDPPETRIPPGSERLFRQVTIDHWNEVTELPSSMAFGPATIDKKMSSHTRSSVVNAQDSRSWHRKHAAKPSVGVWFLSVSQVEGEGLQAVDDSAVPVPKGTPAKPPGHCYVDYRHLTKSERRDIRSRLLRIAIHNKAVPTKG